MILVDGAGHEIDVGDGVDVILELRTVCKECRMVRCFFPKKGGST